LFILILPLPTVVWGEGDFFEDFHLGGKGEGDYFRVAFALGGRGEGDYFFKIFSLDGKKMGIRV
jgi:hypothetical protein